MKIELLHPISHGEKGEDGKAVSKNFSRGEYQTDDPKEENFLPEGLVELFLTFRDPITRQAIAKISKPAGPPKGTVSVAKN